VGYFRVNPAFQIVAHVIGSGGLSAVQEGYQIFEARIPCNEGSN
jgi:hypothetical protein